MTRRRGFEFFSVAFEFFSGCFFISYVSYGISYAGNAISAPKRNRIEINTKTTLSFPGVLGKTAFWMAAPSSDREQVLEGRQFPDQKTLT